MICSTTTPADLGQLVGAGRGRNVDHLVDAILELLKGQRTVVERAGQAEAVVDQRLLARAVAVIHAVQLRHGLVAFVDEHERIVRQIIEQRGRRLAGQPAGKMARVVLDAVAVADLLDHFEIEHGALLQPLRFDAACPASPVRLCHHCSSFSMLRMALLAWSRRTSRSASWDRWAGADRSACTWPSSGSICDRLRSRRPTARCGRRSRRRWGRPRSRRRARGTCRGGNRRRCARRGSRPAAR